VDVYLNMAVFMAQPIRILLLPTKFPLTSTYEVVYIV
jgi:hypothetical protein